MAEQPTQPSSETPQAEEKVEMTREQFNARLELAREAGWKEGIQLALSSVSHYTNNSLSPVLGYSELLLKDPKVPQELKNFLEIINANSAEAGDAIHRLNNLDLDHLVVTTEMGHPYIDPEASEQKAREAKNLKPSEHTEPSSSPQPSEQDPSA